MTSFSFIDLLDEESTPDAFYKRLRDAERKFTEPAQLDALRKEFAIAMRVRSTMEWYRRRESELSALYETANDLTAIRDVDAVLFAIVHRARQLLSADLGYLSLIDAERGDCYMRMTDGAQSAAFPTLRLPLGAGVLGMVVRNATPYATDDYLSEQGIVHLDHVDKAAGEEGIRAVLGVPLLLNGEVIGALLSANRSPRPFSHEEVALLGSLAAHAAIALENARLFEETRTALAELNTANSEVRARSESLELAANAHDRLAEVMLRGGGVADVATVVAEVLDGRVWVFDPDGRQLAVGGGHDVDCGVELGPSVAKALETGRTTEVAVAPDERRGIAVARAGSEHLATVVLGRGDVLDDSDRRILERTAVVTALVLMFQRSVAEVEDRVRGELLDDLLSDPHRDPDAVRERARRHGVDLDAPHLVVVVSVDGVARHLSATASARLVMNRHGLAGLRGGEVVVVVPAVDAMGTARRVAQQLAGVLDKTVTAGVSGPAVGLAQIVDAYREARQCLGTLLALDRRGEVADAPSLGFARFLLGSGSRADAEDYLRRALGPVLAYDARRGTQLAATMDEWFAVGGSHSAAAERLHVHVNTVAQRLERVAVLLGEDWRRPARALDIQLALRIWRIHGRTRRDRD